MSVPREHTVVRLMRRPVGDVKPGTDLVAVKERCPQPADLGHNQVLLQRLFLSLDPAMRGWMRDIPSYIPPVAVGAIMRGTTISQVVASTSDQFRVGGIVKDNAEGGWSEYGVVDAKVCQAVEDLPGLPLSAHLGVLGTTGLTAYFGLLRVGLPLTGETVLVSGAAGATGSVVCQIAKIKGCKVIGVAGGRDKCEWLRRDVGVDDAIDYKLANGDPAKFQELLRSSLRTVGSRGVDVYFDNVGGFILNETLRRLNQRARVVVCGAISSYNATDERGALGSGLSNHMALITQRARMEGFIVFDYRSEYTTAQRELAQWIAEGRLRFQEDVRDGLAKAPEHFKALFDGGNRGKLVVRIGERTGRSKI